MPPFEEIDNTADWAFRVNAASRESLFTEAAEALYRMGGIQTDNESGPVRTIRLQADDLESLFVQWLNELIFLLDHEALALRTIKIGELKDTALVASGYPAKVIGVGKYIKAATYGGLRIIEENGVWKVTVVLDV